MIAREIVKNNLNHENFIEIICLKISSISAMANKQKNTKFFDEQINRKA